jgi:hypothetical protein
MRKLLASLGCAAMVAVGGAGVARAESPIVGAVAQERYALGEYAARDARWTDSYQHFLAAWSLSPGAYTAGELGRVEVELGLHEAAQQHLARALAELPQEEIGARGLVQQSLERSRAACPARDGTTRPATPAAAAPIRSLPVRTARGSWPGPARVVMAGVVFAPVVTPL